jgi:hypothetical protein
MIKVHCGNCVHWLMEIRAAFFVTIHRNEQLGILCDYESFMLQAECIYALAPTLRSKEVYIPTG